jgi:hypothetical protein
VRLRSAKVIHNTSSTESCSTVWNQPKTFAVVPPMFCEPRLEIIVALVPKR